MHFEITTDEKGLDGAIGSEDIGNVNRYVYAHGEVMVNATCGSCKHKRFYKVTKTSETNVLWEEVFVVQHDSDCATHNEPAEPAGECDCSLAKLAA